MIPILYEYNATDFSNYGLGALKDAIECTVSEERNGAFEMVLKYPVGGFLGNEIQKERIIKAAANSNQRYQAFRIYRITRPMNGAITVYAQHVSYDLAYIVAPPVNIRGDFLTYSVERFRQYSFPSMAAFTFENTVPNEKLVLETNSPKNVRSLLINKELSVVQYTQGDIEFDNFVIRYYTSRGRDNGLTILFGKNLSLIQHDSDNTNVYSHLCPYAYAKSGDTTILLTLSEGAIEMPSILSVQKCMVMDFSDRFEGSLQLEPTESNLRWMAQIYLYYNFPGIESPNITVSFEELGEINAEKNINLCDIVTVKYPDLGINVKTRIVRLVYDCLLEKVKTISLGEIKQNLADDITSINKDIKKLNDRVRALEKK